MDHDSAIVGRMDVQLHAVGIEHDGSTEGGSGILVLVTGSAAVGDNARASHGSKYSAWSERPNRVDHVQIRNKREQSLGQGVEQAEWARSEVRIRGDVEGRRR